MLVNLIIALINSFFTLITKLGKAQLPVDETTTSENKIIIIPALNITYIN